jgi:hypothetical protein
LFISIAPSVELVVPGFLNQLLTSPANAHRKLMAARYRACSSAVPNSKILGKAHG